MPRMKKCRCCKKSFEPQKPMQTACSIACSVEIARQKRLSVEKKKKAQDRKADREKLESLKPLSYFAEKAQKAVNSAIRERDKDEPCISCGRFHNGKWNAGHYISRGRSPALRFHPDNIHKQCEPCNTSLSGNLIEYRKNLIKKIGIERVEWLEKDHPPPRWRRAEYEEIEKNAKAELIRLKSIE